MTSLLEIYIRHHPEYYREKHCLKGHVRPMLYMYRPYYGSLPVIENEDNKVLAKYGEPDFIYWFREVLLSRSFKSHEDVFEYAKHCLPTSSDDEIRAIVSPALPFIHYFDPSAFRRLGGGIS